MVKKVNYEVIKDLGPVEIRRYPELLLATVHGLDDNASFSLLFDYITGSNEGRDKIEMTAPVVSFRGLSARSSEWPDRDFFTFVMPEKYNMDNAPRPQDDRIDIHVQKPKMFAVVRFKGSETKKRLDEAESILRKALEEASIKTKGPPFLMRYSSPMRPGFLRTNEVGIEVMLKG